MRAAFVSGEYVVVGVILENSGLTGIAKLLAACFETQMGVLEDIWLSGQLPK